MIIHTLYPFPDKVYKHENQTDPSTGGHGGSHILDSEKHQFIVTFSRFKQYLRPPGPTPNPKSTGNYKRLVQGIQCGLNNC